MTAEPNSSARPRTVLVIGYGNPGRLDDGLGPALAEKIEREDVPRVTVDSDYQLTVEDAADVAEHSVVVFADAAVSGAEPFYFRRIQPEAAGGISSHSVSPEAVMALAASCFGADTRGYILGIRGYEFDGFGEGLTDKAAANLECAAAFLDTVIRDDTFEKAADEYDEPAKQERGTDMRNGKHVILCVDDDPDILEVAKMILEANDYECVGAASAEEGLQKFDETEPDFIFVDLMMEEIDAGTSFVKELKLKGNTAPVYMLSSVGDALNSNINYGELGLTGVFQKPIHPDRMLKTIKSHLS